MGLESPFERAVKYWFGMLSSEDFNFKDRLVSAQKMLQDENVFLEPLSHRRAKLSER